MVVEDDDAIALVLEDLLQGEGFAVQRAANGAAALDLLREFRPDVILLDLMMPVLDGWAFRAAQRRLEQPFAAVPVVVLSGAREANAAGAELDAAAVIVKPFALDALVETVRQLTS
jgi:two-component system, chemotaxis family, chemotaxis protein CheY